MERHHRGGYDYVLAPGAASGPTVVLLHGTGDDAASFLTLGRAVAPEATLVSVQGNVDENGMARFFRREAMGVYDMADLAARTDGFAGFLEAVLPHHGLDVATAVGLGYSNGANLLANLAVRHPMALRRLVLLHPLIPFPLPKVDLDGMALLVTAGRDDPICPWPLTEQLVAALGARGAAVTLEAHGGGHELRPTELTSAATFVAGA